MTIDNATREDASLIADAILEAIGPEITANLAGESHTVKDVHDMFRRLAERADTQYSYLNTRIAHTDDDTPAGVCVSYDGADLKRLRREFFRVATATLGWEITDEEIENLPGETEPDEFYLDTLMVLPQFRGHGIAKALIADAARKANRAGKPLGLLCDLDNHRAYRLYESVGFHHAGIRPFAGHDMYHMQMSTDARTSAPYKDETDFVPGHIDGKWGYFDGRGNAAIPFTYDWAWPFSEGMACVKKGAGWGFIDTGGNVAIPFIYEQADSFFEGLAKVHIDGKEYHIDHAGNRISELPEL